MAAPSPSPPPNRNSSRPDRSSDWLDGTKAGIVGGGVLSLPFAGLTAVLGGTLAGGVTNSLAGMGTAALVGFLAVVFSWVVLGTILGALAGHLQVLRYQADLTKLTIAGTFVWYVLGDLANVGFSIALFTGLIFNAIFASIFGTALGYMIGWADSTWFRPTNSVFDQVRRGETPSRPVGEASPETETLGNSGLGRRAPVKILPEAPIGDPPQGYDLIELRPGLPPLLAACKEGNSGKIEQLLAAGEDLRQTAAEGELSALHIAAVSGVMEVASMLISRTSPWTSKPDTA